MASEVKDIRVYLLSLECYKHNGCVDRYEKYINNSDVVPGATVKPKAENAHGGYWQNAGYVPGYHGYNQDAHDVGKDVEQLTDN